MGVGARAARGVESYGGQAEKHTEQLGSSARVTRLRAAQQWCAVAAAYIQATFRMLLSLCRTETVTLLRIRARVCQRHTTLQSATCGMQERGSGRRYTAILVYRCTIR